MSAEQERRLAERFAALRDPLQRADWRDVERRAGPRRRVRFGAAAALALAIAIAAPAVGSQIIGSFAKTGKPVPQARLSALDRSSLTSMCAHVVLEQRRGTRRRRAAAKACRRSSRSQATASASTTS